MSQSEPSDRRDFLSGRSLRAEADVAADGSSQPDKEADVPEAGPTVRLATRAMACEFQVMLNPSPDSTVETWRASDALDLVHLLEDQMTVYRQHSDLLEINRVAAGHSVPVERRLFELIQHSVEIADRTSGAYDPTSHPLVRLWRTCRDELRTPTEAEIGEALQMIGTDQLTIDENAESIRFRQTGVELNLNGIGKGYALDRAAEHLRNEGIGEWLLHGGRSSVLASGDHNGLGGWPVGIGNPLFRETRLATLVLKDQAMGTSGSGTQFFRVEGKRFGHILDPRTGWPVDDMLSVTVVAPSAALADALSTAFFVLGVEKATECVHTWDGVGAILIPKPERGRHLRPVVIGIPEEQIFWDAQQAEPS